MKSFYTSVVRYGNSMLYRGYDTTGQKIFKKDYFKPIFFVNSPKDVGWRGIDETLVAPVQFESMREAKNWLAKYDQLIATSGKEVKIYNLEMNEKDFHKFLYGISIIPISVILLGGFVGWLRKDL